MNTTNDATAIQPLRTLDNPLGELATSVARMEVATSLDEVMELRERLAFMAAQIKGLQVNLETKLMEWINVNGPIQIGTRKIYVGSKRDTHCRALRPALEALMVECGGDWEAFCECLSSGAIKYGAAKTVMTPEVWGQHFEVVTKTELKDGIEKPMKQIVDMDEQFLKRK